MVPLSSLDKSLTSRAKLHRNQAVRPWDGLVVRLLTEASYGRDAVRQPIPMLPGVTAAAIAVYRTNPHLN